jgi:hypothetical protein
VEGRGKGGRSRKRWRDEIEDNLNIMGIKNRQALVRGRREWRKIVWETTVHNGL